MVLRGLNLSKSDHGGKRRKSKTGKPSLNHFQGPKLKLIKSLRACLDQNKVEGPKLDFCKTRGTKNALNPYYYYAMIIVGGMTPGRSRVCQAWLSKIARNRYTQGIRTWSFLTKDTGLPA